MSRLATRIGDLERTLGRCRDCKPTIELVHDTSPNRPQRVDYCPSCRQPIEQITVRVAFDPDTGAQP